MPQSDTEDVAAERGLSRRLLLGGGAAALPAVSTPLAFGGTAVGAATRIETTGAIGAAAPAARRSASPQSHRTSTTRDVPDGYIAQVLIPWGDPMSPTAGVPVRRHEHRRRAGAAVRDGPRRDGVLPHVTQPRPAGGEPRGARLRRCHCSRPPPTTPTRRRCCKAQNAHGVSVCELELRDGVVARHPLALRPAHHSQHRRWS